MDKKSIYLGLILGSIAGGYIPMLWGAGLFSISSILFSALGGLLGIWLVYKLVG